MGEIRIVAGEFRSRRISTPDGADVRPTSDRVREALFDILGPTLDGLRVLDAFAGSGALGFEALSRGAASVTFLETLPAALAVLRANVERLGVGARCRIVARAAESVDVQGLDGAPFDLVLADPPYSEDVRDAFLGRLAAEGAIGPSARIVIERDHGASVARHASGLVPRRTARYGRTCLDFYRRG